MTDTPAAPATAADAPPASPAPQAVQPAQAPAKRPQSESQPQPRPGQRPPRNARARRPNAGATPAGAPSAARAPRSHPLLEQLATLYPQLFGEQPLPLKRGIFQDLMQAHPGPEGVALDKDALKVALSIHTRSGRYLNAVAQGQPRHDLQGNVVEAMAPEHVFHALTEVFRRRQQRSDEDLTPKLQRRIAQAFEASGLSREAYDALVRGKNEQTNAVLDAALQDAAAHIAKDEALLRAFEASGQSEAAFADMYGLPARSAAQQLARARQRRGAA